ncbi:hypothetical protein K435DRAFT_781313 [Dendrothele bispora CBS 962.96]|uniref:Uncharacterized protein n=1 Tax=Dendrothele bispora (strain CBS 962.96) TaxID=1314807 RepID=A0A4S8LME7_DENBC|nr:hypothetical protein K435DRAFT_781313 [Dendrothele bispora CBS 962.96]
MFLLFPMLLVFLLPVILALALALALTLVPGIIDVNPDPVPPLATSPMTLVHAAINSIVCGSEGVM